MLTAHDLPMICLWSPVHLQVATVKMRKMFCTCEKFSVFQKLRKSAHNQWKMQFLNAFLLKKKRVFHWAKTSKMHSKMRNFCMKSFSLILHTPKSKNCDFSSKNVVQIVLFSFEKCWNLNVKNVKNILKLFSNFS